MEREAEGDWQHFVPGCHHYAPPFVSHVSPFCNLFRRNHVSSQEPTLVSRGVRSGFTAQSGGCQRTCPRHCPSRQKSSVSCTQARFLHRAAGCLSPRNGSAFSVGRGLRSGFLQHLTRRPRKEGQGSRRRARVWSAKGPEDSSASSCITPNARPMVSRTSASTPDNSICP